jgi:hypothetical protein
MTAFDDSSGLTGQGSPGQFGAQAAQEIEVRLGGAALKKAAFPDDRAQEVREPASWWLEALWLVSPRMDTRIIIFLWKKLIQDILTARREPRSLSTDTKWLLPKMVPDTEVITPVNFHAEVSQNAVLFSDSAYIMKNRIGSEVGKPSTVSVGGDLTHAKLIYVPIPEESTGLCVVYFAIGMTGYDSVTIESPIGKVTHTGVTRINNYDNLSGSLVIEAPPTAIATERWLADCDRMASRVFDMFSFAQGRLIRWSVRQVQQGDHVLETEFHGPNSTGVPIGPVFPFEYGMVLNLAVNHYTQ